MSEYYPSDTTINTIEEWQLLLQKWSNEWLTTDKRFSPNVRKNKWLGYKPATEKQISTLERKLGYRLPPSFRSFLFTTNGWRRTSTFILRIRSVTKIDWLEVVEPSFMDVWDQFEEECFGKFGGLSQDEYFSYTKQSREAFDKEHFRTSLLISDPIFGETAMYLLNPMVVTEDGEWEAWFSAHWIPGVVRYPSFSHLMLNEYESFRRLELNEKKPSDTDGPFDGFYAPDKPRHQAMRIGPGKPLPRRLTIEELVERLTDSSHKKRKDAALKIFRENKPHDPNDERPLLVESLSCILHSDLERDVRCAAACVLGTYGNVDAIAPLVNALEDPDVATTVVDALRDLSLYYKSSRIADGICEYLSVPQEVTPTKTAIYILKDYREPRLEKIALRILDSDVHKGVRFVAAFALAYISEGAVDELVSRLNHKNPEIREVAAAAVRETNDRSTIPALEKALKDENPNVRFQVETSLSFLQS